MAYALPCLPTRLTDENGKILPGGKMYVFLAGTTTPVDFYTTSDLDVAHAKPQVADESGLFAEAFFAPGTYKIRFTTSAGATIHEIDNYTVEEGGTTISFPTAVKTANFSVQPEDRAKVFLVDTSSGDVIVSADSETLGEGFPFFVRKTASANSVIVQGVGAQTIDGALTKTLVVEYSSLGVVSTGAAGWQAVLTANLGDFSTAVSFSSAVEFASGHSIVGGPLVTPMGRLTLTSGSPVLTSDTIGQTSVYYTPYVGNRIAIPTADGWTCGTFAEVSQALSDATKSPAAAAINTVYDLLGWLDGTTFRISRSAAWASATSRGTGAATAELERVDGVWLNKVAVTNGPAANRGVYLGTIGTNGTGPNGQLNMMFAPTAAAGGTANRLDVWNAYNRTVVSSMVRDSTDSWTGGTAATWRALNNSTSNRVTIVNGLSEDRTLATVSVVGTHSGSSNMAVGVGIDSVTAPTGLVRQSGLNIAATWYNNATAEYRGFVGIGSHYLSALEWYRATTMTFYGDNGDATVYQSGMFVEAMM